MEHKTRYVNKLMIAGTIVNLVPVFLFSMGVSPDEMPPEFSFILNICFQIFILINISGIILSYTIKGKIGPILVMVGSIAFIPAGMIAMYGARQVLDGLKRDAINQEKTDL